MPRQIADDPRLDVVKRQVAEERGWRIVEPAGQEMLATDAAGKTYWLKARTVNRLSDSTSWDWTTMPDSYDALVGILALPSGEILLAIKVPRNTVEREKHVTQDSDRFRWNQGTLCIPGVKWLT